MPKINTIVKVEKKEGGANEVDVFMNGGFNDALIVYGNKSVGLDENELHKIIRANFATIFQVDITMEEIIGRCNNIVLVLKAQESKIIMEELE